MAVNDIKRGVSLYSFQEEYYLRKMSLEDCIAQCAEFGAYGIETIAEQMMPGFPALSDDFYEQWHGWMKKYKTVPTCHDMFLDTKRVKGRLLNDEEMVASLARDIKHASRLGCFCIRILVITPPHIMELCAPIAEEYGVKLLLEIHSPWHFTHEWIVKHIEVMERTKSGILGLMPDLGIFVHTFPSVIYKRSLRNGATPALVKEIIATYDDHGDVAGLPALIESKGGNKEDVGLARNVGHYCDVDPRKMINYMPLIHHIHGKFYEMTEDYREPSIPYDQIIAALKDGDYKGYISSEYEGNRHIQDAFEVDSVEQVRRHQVMLQRLIDGIN
jgi:sugar phosphate isomerase/epimerase